MQLYDCAIAPNPRRLRIFLAEKGLKIPMTEVDLIAGENLGESFLTINPRGLVPSLVLDDGTVIDEVEAICRYFEELHPEPPLLGTDAKSRALIASRQRHAEFDGMIAISEVFRNSAPAFAGRGVPGVAGGSPTIPQLVDRGTATWGRFLRTLDGDLAASEYVAGDRFSLADITALCAIDFAKWVKFEVPAECANVLRWYAAVSARPSALA